MTSKKSRLDDHVEKTEKIFNYMIKKKTQSIQNSLVRPLYQEVLKSLFLIVILLIDTLIPLEILRLFINPFHIIFSFVFIIIILYIEIVVYNLFWGKKGRWSIENYKNISKQNNEEKKI